MDLPITSLSETLPTVLALECPDLLMDSLDVRGKMGFLAKLHTTCDALVGLLLQVSLVMIHHATLMSKPSPTLRALIENALMN